MRTCTEFVKFFNDMQKDETNLLIVPGKDPVWSPDGRLLAFVRDCQALPVAQLVDAERLIFK